LGHELQNIANMIHMNHAETRELKKPKGGSNNQQIKLLIKVAKCLQKNPSSVCVKKYGKTLVNKVLSGATDETSGNTSNDLISELLELVGTLTGGLGGLGGNSGSSGLLGGLTGLTSGLTSGLGGLGGIGGLREAENEKRTDLKKHKPKPSDPLSSLTSLTSLLSGLNGIVPLSGGHSCSGSLLDLGCLTQITNLLTGNAGLVTCLTGGDVEKCIQKFGKKAVNKLLGGLGLGLGRVCVHSICCVRHPPC
jgi:hypothetical protein